MTRVCRQFAIALFAGLVLAASSLAASAATRILTLTVIPATAELTAVYFNGLPGEILSASGEWTFVRVDDHGAGFQCRNNIAVVTRAGRTGSAFTDVCENNWQATIDLRDLGGGSSVRRITVTPANPELRILTLALDGTPQPFTAFTNSNRVEFDIRRTPSGFVCARQLQALLSNGRTFDRQVDLCANDNQVILDDRPVAYYEVLTVRTEADDRIVAVSIDGEDVSIYASISDGVRVQVLAGDQGIQCQVRLGARFASGRLASRQVNMCTENWDVTLNPTRQYETDRSYGPPRTWRHVGSNDAGVPTRLVYQAQGRLPAFEARCLPGARTAALYFSGFLSNTVRSPRPNFLFEAGGYRSTAQGRLDTLPDTSIADIPAITLRTSSGLWNGLIAGARFVITINDNHRVTYSLSGSAAPVRDFVENCNTRPRVFGPTVIGDVSGDTTLGWRFSAGVEPRLSYGNPVAGRLGFEAVCQPGSGTTRASFHSVPTGMAPGRRIDIDWSIVSRNGYFEGRTANRPDIDWGAIGTASISADDSFYSAIIAGSILRLAVNGTPVTTYSLRGSAGPTRAFVDACRAPFVFGGGSQGGGQSSEPDAADVFRTLLGIFEAVQSARQQSQQPPADPVAEALAEYRRNSNYACALEDTLTGAGGLAVDAVFTNERVHPVSLFAIGADGSRRFVANIGPGGTRTIESRVNQGWVITAPNGVCLTTFASPRRQAELPIRRIVEQPDPDVYVRRYICAGGEEIAVLVEPNRGKALVAGEFPMQWVRFERAERYAWGTSSAVIEETTLRLFADGELRLACEGAAG